MLVYVQDQEGQPLMPTRRCGAVRRWLKGGRAVVVRREPFTIRLVGRVGGYVQPLQAGVDLGTAHVGVAVISEREEVFAGEFHLRTDLSRLLTERRQFRRSRRSRQCRHRAPRFRNRRRSDELTPSVRARVDETRRVVRLVASILPVAHWTFEVGNFDPHRLVNPAVAGVGYQQGAQYGFENVRQYVLWRDRHTCQACHGQSGDPRLTVHHLRQRREQGSNRPPNLITLCWTCHRRHYQGPPLSLPQPPESVRDATQFNVVKTYTLRAVAHLPHALTFGYITRSWCRALGLEKSHRNDAFVIAGGQAQPRAANVYGGTFFRRQNRKLYKGSRSHLRNTIPQAHGFRRGDRVRLADGREGFIHGLRSSGYFDVRRLDGAVLSHSAGHKTLRRVEGARTLRIERITTAKGGMAASSTC